MSQHDDAIAVWLKEAAADLTAPTALARMAAALRWTARVAKLKAQAANAERALRLLEAQREATRGWLMVHNPTALALIDFPGGIELGAPDRVLVDNARVEWTHLAEELELAERIARLLERPRASAAPKAAASPTAKPATRFGVTQGGKR